MKTVEDYEQMRRAYFVEKLSIREIRRRLGYQRETVHIAMANPIPGG